MKPNLGDVLADKYRLDAVLGEGGMSMVFAAVNVLTGKQVAIKWLQPEIVRDEEHSQRLLREAQATSSIDHPNVVNLFDVGRHDGALFLVMEHLHGEPLSELLARGRQDPAQFIKLMMPVLRGVQAAHRMGIVHRDLKPDNIFFCRDPHGEPREPKVLDFGISKLADGSLRPGQELTREGTVFGTPQYMAPEQMRDARVADVRSDIYALGVIFYRAFADEYPYDADTLTALAIRIVEGDAVPLQELCPELDVGLADIVMRALALDPDHRFQSVAALGQALEQHADGALFAPIPERDSSPPLRRDSMLGLHDGGSVPLRSQPLRIDRSQRLSQPLHGALAARLQTPLAPSLRLQTDVTPPLRLSVVPPATDGGSELGDTVPDAADGQQGAPALLDAAADSPHAVTARPSRGLELETRDPEHTQRVEVAPRSRKRSVFVGATLFAVGLLAPLGWQLGLKLTSTHERSALAVSREVPSTRFAMASAKLAAEQEQREQALTHAPTAPTVVRTPRASEQATAEPPRGKGAEEVAGLEAPEALPPGPSAPLAERATEKLKRRATGSVRPGLRSAVATTPTSATPQPAASGNSAPADNLAERPSSAQTERNPYLRR